MRKLLFLCAAFLVSSFTPTSPTLSDKERKDAIEQLSKTEQGVFNSLKGLSDAQLNFKAAPDKWSISDCVKHIAKTELVPMANDRCGAEATCRFRKTQCDQSNRRSAFTNGRKPRTEDQNRSPFRTTKHRL